MKHLLYLLAALVLLAACKKEEKQQRKVVENTKQAPQKHVMEMYNYSDSIAGSPYYYTIHREADSTLSVVVDEFGDTYVDNAYELTIKRAGADFFSHRFTKASFSQMDEHLKATTIFDGFRFVRRENGVIYFSVCLSEPDTDLSVPYILAVGPDGSYTISPDNTPDLDEAEEEEGV